jgi:hypothetical protein
MSTTTSTHLQAIVQQLARTSLEATVDVAGLQIRTDRKYVIDPAMLHAVVQAVGPHAHVLDIMGAQCFDYRSVYFDTADLVAYRSAAHRRAGRFKVRTRTYVDTGQCMLEVKTKDERRRTVKHRLAYQPTDERRITADGRAFVDEHICRVPPLGELVPVLTTTYRRVTLVDPTHGARLTIDADLVCRDERGGEVRLPDHVIVETKSAGAATPADRVLWRCGIRPVAISKYCVGMASLDPTLPANHWNRTLQRWFGRTPAHRRAA